MSAVALSNFVTVSQLAGELGLSNERVRQLISELQNEDAQKGREFGTMAGRAIILSNGEASRVKARHEKKRKYEKATA